MEPSKGDFRLVFGKEIATMSFLQVFFLLETKVVMNGIYKTFLVVKSID